MRLPSGVLMHGSRGDSIFFHVAARNLLYLGPISPPVPALETTHGQMDGFFSQLPFKCHLSKGWHLWEVDLGFALNSTPGWSAASGYVWFMQIHRVVCGPAK